MWLSIVKMDTLSRTKSVRANPTISSGELYSYWPTTDAGYQERGDGMGTEATPSIRSRDNTKMLNTY